VDSLLRVWVIGLLLAGAVFNSAAAAGRVPTPEFPAAVDGQVCVAPNEDMRRNHMRYLQHQRDDTVRSGIRSRKYSLRGCIECHAQTDADGAYLPVNASGQFCNACHEYAAVRMDCFQCHATKPESGTTVTKEQSNK